MRPAAGDESQFEIIHLHRLAPPKPDVGEPCNGCGVCCALETCPIGRLRFLRKRGPCPALRWQGEANRYFCGLLTNPEQFLPRLDWLGRERVVRWLSRRIAAGIGCDCAVDAEIPLNNN